MKKNSAKRVFANIMAIINVVIIVLAMASFLLFFLSEEIIPQNNNAGSVTLFFNDGKVAPADTEKESLMLVKKADAYSLNDKVLVSVNLGDTTEMKQGRIESIDEGNLIIKDMYSESQLKALTEECYGKVLVENDMLGKVVSFAKDNPSRFYIIVESSILFVIVSNIIVILVLNMGNRKKNTAEAQADGDLDVEVVESPQDPEKTMQEIKAHFKPEEAEQAESEPNEPIVSEEPIVSVEPIATETENIEADSVDVEKENLEAMIKYNETIEFDPTNHESEVPVGVHVNTQTITSTPYKITDSDKVLEKAVHIMDEEDFVQDEAPVKVAEEKKAKIEHIYVTAGEDKTVVEYDEKYDESVEDEKFEEIEEPIVEPIAEEIEELKEIEEIEEVYPVEEPQAELSVEPEAEIQQQEPAQEENLAVDYLNLGQDDLDKFINDLLQKDIATNPSDVDMSDDDLEKLKNEILSM